MARAVAHLLDTLLEVRPLHRHFGEFHDVLPTSTLGYRIPVSSSMVTETGWFARTLTLPGLAWRMPICPRTMVTRTTYDPGANTTEKCPCASVVAVATTAPLDVSIFTSRLATGLSGQGVILDSTGQVGPATT